MNASASAVPPRSCAASLLFPTHNDIAHEANGDTDNDSVGFDGKNGGGISDAEVVVDSGGSWGSSRSYSTDNGGAVVRSGGPSVWDGGSGGGIGAGERRASFALSSRHLRLPTLPAKDDSMRCIDEEEPEQLDT